MDESLRHINPNPTLTANFISRGLFWWCNPIFKKGYKTPLEASDLYNVCPSDASDYLGNRLESAWIQQLKRQDKGGKPSLLKALLKTFGVHYMLVGFVVLLEETTKVIQPLLLGGLIRYFTPNSAVSKFEAWMFALGVSLCAIVLGVAHHPYFFWVQRIGMRMRVACCSLMYRKCLRLSNKAMGETTVGQIVNLMSNDVNRFDQAVIFLHFLWVGPLQALAVLVILWHELGPSVLAGFFVLILLIPVQGFMGRLFSKFRHKTAIHTDERVKVMNEIISGMRVIKMYCWEKPFGELVERIRGRERASLWRIRQLTAYTSSVWVIVHRVLYYSLAVGVVITQSWPSLRPASLYMATPLLFLVAYNLVGCVFEAARSLGEFYAASLRIQKFLLLDELESSVPGEQTNLRPKEDQSWLEMVGVTAKWDGNTTESNTLEDVSLRVESGQLVAVIGPVGAGKSSLLMAILGELPAKVGEIQLSGRLAYVSQQAWIFSGSVRQNIVFGGVFDKVKYDRVVKVSALKRDFEIMPQGDATLIGDRGVSLSGGQRARVSLARALYMDADIYLLDDPLSAVDSAVGRHIFEKCILRYLKNKPRILVTHQVQFLPAANRIYILKDGRITIDGTFDELSGSGVDFSELLKSTEDETTPATVSQGLAPHLGDGVAPMAGQDLGSRMSLHSIVDSYEPEPVQLPEEEERASGTVGYKVYVDYFRAGTGIFKFILLVVVNLAAQLFYVGSDWWLSRWSNQEEDKYAALEQQRLFFAANNITDLNNILLNNTISSSSSSIGSNFTMASNITIPWVDSHFNINVFTGIILAVFFLGLCRALLFFRIAVCASQELHNRMFARILKAPVSFFDTNPVGRILNRFSKDVGHMDDLLPVTFFDFIQCFLLIVGIVLVAGVVNPYVFIPTVPLVIVFFLVRKYYPGHAGCFLLIVGIVLVAGVVNPYVFIPTVPLVILFFLVRKYYLQTSRSIKRLEGTSRSPVFSYLSATLQGLHTIRSMRMEEKFMEEFDAYQDRHSEAWFMFLATSRWLAVRLDWLCSMFVTAVTVCSVLAADSMNAGLVGLSITYTMTLMGMFQWGVRQSAEVENQMISVERVLEYSRLPQEADLESTPDKKPATAWPLNGTIVGTDVCLQYSPDGPLVLKNLNFVVHGREKVGIVGRTGAGKSSLITTLYRLAEPQGSILIDNVNIQQIGLHDLRSRISIIPQDPVLFSGSLQRNLDPFHHHTDEQLWTALEEVQLKDQIKDIPEGLSAEVSEGGVNFSVGQRQLICLARAILGSNKILLIDEATANVDPITDELIQQTIRTKFRDCTVLTIAHRLHTIMDSDRVMVLDMGQIVEFDKPYNLLSSGRGFFFDMVQQLGKTEFDHLSEIAHKAADDRVKSSVVPNGVILQSTRSPQEQDSMASLSDSEAAGPKYDLDDIEESLRLVGEDVVEEGAHKEVPGNEQSSAELPRVGLDTQNDPLLESSKDEVPSPTTAAGTTTAAMTITVADTVAMSTTAATAMTTTATAVTSMTTSTIASNTSVMTTAAAAAGNYELASSGSLDEVQPLISGQELTNSIVADDDGDDNNDNDDGGGDEGQLLIKARNSGGSLEDLRKRLSSNDDAIDV